MTDDLHQRVTARIAELRAGAEAANAYRGRGYSYDITVSLAGVPDSVASMARDRYERSFPPAFVLRWLDWAQGVADEHKGIHRCLGGDLYGFPEDSCPPLVRAAKALGIEEGG